MCCITVRLRGYLGLWCGQLHKGQCVALQGCAVCLIAVQLQGEHAVHTAALGTLGAPAT